MSIFLIPILILIGIFVVSTGGNFLGNINFSLNDFLFSPEKTIEEPAAQRTTTPPPRPSTIQQAPLKTSPLFVLDTVITKGPTEDTKISDTNVVTFEFEGSVNPTNTTGRITFETKVEGVDPDWKTTSSRQRKITLPAGQNEYTFTVRAKLGKEVDSTPAQQSFSIAVSPFFGKIYIQSARAATSSSSSLIILKPRIESQETVNLTGFKIQGRSGSFTIPLGIKRFRPGVGNTPIDPIVVTRSDTVKISGERGPFGLGGNFRPNICMGYLKQIHTFPLSFSTSCNFQKPAERDILFLPLHCQDFVLKKINFSSCKVPQYPEDPSVFQAGSAECASFLRENFSYNACFDQYQKESNFLKNEWHVYTNTDFINSRYDLLKLYDANSLLVDTKELL